MKADLRMHMKYGASLRDRRFRSPETIAHHSGLCPRHVIEELRKMEKRGEVESRRGYGRAHGNRKVWRLAR